MEQKEELSEKTDAPAEERKEVPVAVCDTEVTKEKYEKVNYAMTRNFRCLTILYLICGGVLTLLSAVLIADSSARKMEFYATMDYLPIGFLGLAFLGLGVFLLFRKKSGGKAYETYTRINPDLTIHMEFYSDRAEVSNQNNSNTYFYANMTSWAESDDLYLLYFGNKFQQVAVFVLKDGFASDAEREKFFFLMNSALAGKKFKRIK